VCIPSRDAAFAAEAHRLVASMPAHLSPRDAIDWFEGELRRAFPSASVREQTDLARSSPDGVTWYATLRDERFRIQMDLHVPLPPVAAFDVYATRVTEWQLAVALTPRKLQPDLVGSEYDAVYTFLGRDYAGTFRIVAATPPESISLEAEGSGITVMYTTTFAAEPPGSLVRVHGNYSLPDHVLARVADRLGLERAITRDIQRANEAYRRLCEEVSRAAE
jgi:hypothetical protein